MYGDEHTDQKMALNEARLIAAYWGYVNEMRLNLIISTIASSSNKRSSIAINLSKIT